MTKLKAILKTILVRKDGATMIEYGLMLAFIAIVCFSAVQTFGLAVKGLFPPVSATL